MDCFYCVFWVLFIRAYLFFTCPVSFTEEPMNARSSVALMHMNECFNSNDASNFFFLLFLSLSLRSCFGQWNIWIFINWIKRTLPFEVKRITEDNSLTIMLHSPCWIEWERNIQCSGADFQQKWIQLLNYLTTQKKMKEKKTQTSKYNR